MNVCLIKIVAIKATPTVTGYTSEIYCFTYWGPTRIFEQNKWLIQGDNK